MPRNANANKNAPYVTQAEDEFDDLDGTELEDRMLAQQVAAGEGRQSNLMLSSDDTPFA